MTYNTYSRLQFSISLCGGTYTYLKTLQTHSKNNQSFENCFKILKILICRDEGKKVKR